MLRCPLGSGIRVDTGIAQGDVIPPDYDSMVAKTIAWGRDRNEALARLRTALRETTVVIDGGTTNKSFLLDLLDRDEVVSATADTGWLNRTGAGTATGPTPTAEIALIAAAVDANEAEEALETKPLSWPRHAVVDARHPRHRPRVELNYQGQAYSLTVGQIGPRSYRVVGDSGELVVGVERLGEYESSSPALSTCLRCNGNSALGGSGAVEVRGSGGFRRPGDVVPGGEAVGHLGAIVIGGEPMAAGPEMRGDHAEHRQEPLGSAGGAEAFHGAFALPGRLVRVLRPVVQVPRLPVLDRRHHRRCAT